MTPDLDRYLRPVSISPSTNKRGGGFHTVRSPVCVCGGEVGLDAGPVTQPIIGIGAVGIEEFVGEPIITAS